MRPSSERSLTAPRSTATPRRVLYGVGSPSKNSEDMGGGGTEPLPGCERGGMLGNP